MTPRNSLLSRKADFWMMGGASLLVWLPVMLLFHAGMLRQESSLLLSIQVVATVTSFLMFHPHFIFAYKMAYSRGPKFISQHWPQLIALPVGFAVYYAFAISYYRDPVNSNLFTTLFPGAALLGRGEIMVSISLSLMFLLLGWHHAKQTFGCSMMYRKFDNYPVSRVQRGLLLATMYGLWTVNVIINQSADHATDSFYGVPLFSLRLSSEFRAVLMVGFWSLVGLCGYAIIWRNWQAYRKLPSWNFLIPVVAILLWWAPPFYVMIFYVQFSTIFHALQYWPFYIRYERERSKSPSHLRWISIFLFALAGGAFFLIVPKLADDLLRPDAIGSVSLFLIATQTALNIHHYFIDSVIWRMHQPEVRRYFLGEVSDESEGLRQPARS